jgi:peptide/nickel transport system substrate-binding protein
MVSRRKLAVSIGIVAVAAISLLAANWAGAQGKAASVPRNQALITSGTSWGAESNFNPFGGGWATGMVGLVNETLLRYDPLTDKYIPWLATKAGFQGKNYVIQVRKGVKFNNGKALTAAVVASDIKLGRFETAYWATLYNTVKKLKVKGNTITVVFKTKVKVKVNGATKTIKNKPSYIQWQNLMWNLPIVWPGQFSGINKLNFTTLGSAAGWVPIGTGPYVLDKAASDPSTGVVWQKRSKKSWWASAKKIAPSPAPTFIEDLVNTSNTNALEGLLKNIEDLNNNYLPGIQNLVKKGQAQTYFKGSPYDLPANTAWLEVNTTKKALSDPQFRKALAEAVNTSKITGSGDYNGITTVANQTGLLKVWKKWINNSLVKKYGFKQSSTSAAKATLKAAGYKVGSNGFVNNKDGSKLKLNIEVPSGWSDWEAARSIIVSGERAAGIDVNVVTGSQGQVQTTDRNQGKFDLEVDNAYQLSDNPWTYFNGIFHLPIITSGSGQTFANFGRYGNAKAWAMVKKLDQTPPTNVKGRKAILSALEKIELTQIPIIPLWYNGIWSQTQSKYWNNWPSATKKGMHFIPCMWGGYLQMTGIDTITHIKKA